MRELNSLSESEKMRRIRYNRKK